MGRLVLVVGGQKSGKSSTAQRLAEAAGGPVTVVAPCEPGDEEMVERVARHRTDRPGGWVTVETFAVADAVAEAVAGAVVVDALDTWLPHAIGVAGLWPRGEVEALGPEGEAAAGRVLDEVAAIVDAARRHAGDTVLVAGLPGYGLHAGSAAGRRYVDLHGRMLRLIGERADRVLHVVAGRAHELRDAVAVPAAPPPVGLDDLRERVLPTDRAAAAAAAARWDRLAKPTGSLGRVEDLGVRLAAIAGRCPPPVPRRPVLVVAAADHGVHGQGVTPWPQEVTAAVVGAVAAGLATCNAIAGSAGADVVVLDVGCAAPLADAPRLVRARVAEGTRDLRVTDAMSVEEATAALSAGAGTVERLVDEGADLVLTGDVGLGNTTAAACLVGALTGASAAEVTGRGSGIDDATLARKREVVADALARVAGRDDPLDVLRAVGGLEHAALAGVVLAAAARRVPVVLDGVTTVAAALVADRLAPGAAAYAVAGHRSPEPAATAALAALGLDPLLELGLRLGEGTGALLAAPLVRATAAALRDTALLTDLVAPSG